MKFKEIGLVTNRDRTNSMTNEEFARFYLSNSDKYSYTWNGENGKKIVLSLEIKEK